ncbi:MAG: isopentenyl-diphosphate Delta-isomerase [Actinobacteria bacterium]|nr:isopentenyl-diphosphate Delta-isomerase [Actinomycetota bacterium]
MAELARDPARRASLAGRAREHVLARHDIEGGAEAWYEDLRGLHEVFRVHSPRRPTEPTVVLVDSTDHQIGTLAKIDAHKAPGRLHRALSTFVVDRDGRLLLQRRASTKYHFAERWSNTCCTHPEPGEGVVAAGARRLDEELGFTCDLVDVGTFTYTATDPSSGLVERELDHVLVGRSDGPVDPDPAEVSETRWISVDDLRTEMAEHPDTFTPWLAEALEVAAPFLPFPQANVEVSPDAAIAEPEPEPDAEIDGDLDLADHAGSS